MGRVVAATDAETGAEVALKMPLSAEPQLLEYFEREVRTLRSLDHPGVVKLREHGLDSGLPWCAMERLVGPTLREVFKETFQTQKFGDPTETPSFSTLPLNTGAVSDDISPSSTLKPSIPTFAPESFWRFAVQILDSLEHVHSRHIIHGDLKPENIILIEGERPVLIDFGIAIHFDDSRDDLAATPRTVGTAAYMAPERLMSRSFDVRADYYALGCLLYEALSGKSPFARSDVNATILAQLRSCPPLLHSLDPKISRRLSEMVDRLLSKSPQDRPGYASEIRDALLPPSMTHRDTTVPHRQTEKDGVEANYLHRSVLIGREAPLSKVRESIARARSGRGTNLRLTGAPGIGKTRLLMECLDIAERSGLQVVQAMPGSYRQAAEVSFSSLRVLLNVLRPSLAELSKNQDGVPFPLKHHTEDFRQALVADGAALFLSALRHHCCRSPTLLAIDCPESLDQASLALLSELAKTSTVQWSLLTIWTESSSHELSCEEAEEVPLRAFSREQTAAFLHSMLGVERLSVQVQGRLFEVSEGNPHLLRRYLIALIDENALIRSKYQGWHWNTEGDERLRTASARTALRSLFLGPLKSLSEDHRAVAEEAAILGRSFHLSSLAQLSDSTVEEVARKVALLAQEHVVEALSDNQYRFVSSETQTLLRAQLDPERAKELHSRAVVALKPRLADDPRLIGDVALHLAKGGQHEVAARFYREAAAQHQATNELSLSAALLENALEQLALAGTDLAQTVLPDVCEELGDIYRQLRELDKAEHFYLRAVSETTNSVATKARRLRKLSAAHDRDKDKALLDLSEALTLLQDSVEENLESRAEWIECQLAAMFIHYWRHETTKVLSIAKVVEPHVENKGTPRQQASYHFNLAAGLMRHRRYETRGDELEHIDQALKLYRDLSDDSRVSMCGFLRSLILLCSGKLDEADEGFSGVLKVSEQSASVTIQVRALTYLALVARMKGASHRVRRLAASALSLAQEHGIKEYEGTALANLAWLALQDGEPERCITFAAQAVQAWDLAPVVSPFCWTACVPWLAAQEQCPASTPMRIPSKQLIERILDPLQQKPPREVLTAAQFVLKHEEETPEAQRESLLHFLQAAESARWL